MKESQYRPSSIKNRPVKQEEPTSEQDESTNPWEAFKAFIAGIPQGFLNTGLTNRQQFEWAKRRKQRGLPPISYKKRWFPFRRASSWFKDLYERDMKEF